MSKIDNTRPGHIVDDTGTPLTQRTNLSFIGATLVDIPGTDTTEITITASASQSRAFAYFIS